MTERAQTYGNDSSTKGSGGGGSDLGPKKTMFVLVVVVGCFAVLWPKVFYPMLVGSANQHIKPSPVDRTTGCCDVISEKDVNTIKIMSELCGSIAQKDGDSPLTGREMVTRCSAAILDTCGIDITEVLQEKVRLGHTTRQILDQVRSLNGSLCLKYNFGVAPWRLGVPHRVNAKVSPSYTVRQERPIHLRSEMVHPAFRERGSAIPQTHPAPAPARPTPSKVMPGRPGPIPAMRPTLGGAGHMVPPPKQSTGTMGLIMPVYTIAIVIFFTYTVMRIVFKKQPESLYPDVTPDPVFRKEVFQSNRGRLASRTTKNDSKLGDAELDQLRRRLRETEMAMERIVEQMSKVPLKKQDVVANGGVPKQEEEEQPSVKVLGMETRASCEGGKRWSRSGSPAPPVGHPVVVRQPAEPPQEIYLEGSLPPQSHHLLVSDAATEAQRMTSEEDPAVVLAGKMTLSVISLDSSENGTDKSSDSDKKTDDRSSSNVSEDFEKIEVDIDEQINSIIEQAQEMALDQSLLDEIKKELSEIGNEKTSQSITDEVEEADVEIPETNNQDIKAETPIAETGSEASEQFIASEIEENKPQEAEILAGDSTTLDEAETEVIEAEEDVKPDTSGIGEIENAPIAENGSEAPETFVASEIDVKELQDAEIIAENSTEPDDGFVQDSIGEAASIATDNFVASEIEAHKLQEAEIMAGDDSIDNEDVQESTEEVKTEADFDVEVKEPSDNKQIPVFTDSDPGSLEQAELDKLNSAIADLGNEFRPKPVTDPVAESAILLQSEREEADEEPDEEDEEEIEYEYEESDNEDVDDEIRNVGRLEGGEDVLVPQLNGESTDKAKNGLMGSSSAEDDLTDEEQLVNDDEDVEEIIEYITDEEEEEEDEEDVESEHRNNVNHLNDNAGPAS